MKGWYLLYIHMGKVDFNLVPFPMSHLRETVILGLLIYIEALMLGNTDSLIELYSLWPSLPQALVQPRMEKGLFKATKPQMLEESQGPKS